MTFTDYDQGHLDGFAPVVESVASDMSRRYWRYAGGSQEDLASECYLWLFQHSAKVLGWLEDYDVNGFEKMLARTLRNELHDIGETLKAEALGYSRDELFYYSKGMVRELLPAMFDEEAWLHPEQSPGERKAPSAPAEGGNWVATLADLSRAYDTLGEEDRDLLAAFHRDSWSNKMLAEANSVTEQTMSYRHDRAVKHLVDALGGPRPRAQHDEDCEHTFRWRAGRAAMSNAQSRSIQSTYYEDD